LLAIGLMIISGRQRMNAAPGQTGSRDQIRD
jgi:hypothetical protein